MSSKVFFTTMRTTPDDSIPEKLTRLLKAAGLKDLDLDGKYVAIKMHFGAQGNVTHLRPQYPRAVADLVTALGGKPFVTDCSTLYGGMRNDALGHLECAAMNGFNSVSCGCPVLISDGLRGTDEVIVPVPNPAGVETLVTEAAIGRGILDADTLITLTHAKGCNAVSYGGTIKNLAMGCASKGGKLVMHSKGAPAVTDACVGCGRCRTSCGQNALELRNGRAFINENCAGCGHCISYCPRNAIVPVYNRMREDMQMKMAEYAAAVSSKVQCFHVSVAIDITPQCDCFVGNDTPMVPNIGMFASADPVAIDTAVTDAINAQPMIESGALPALYEASPEQRTHLDAINPVSHWELLLQHAEDLGVGTRSYELVEVK